MCMSLFIYLLLLCNIIVAVQMLHVVEKRKKKRGASVARINIYIMQHATLMHTAHAYLMCNAIITVREQLLHNKFMLL